LKDELFTEV
ncbi:hypothetical protein RRG08_004989, partial [Elysia crispata]